MGQLLDRTYIKHNQVKRIQNSKEFEGLV